MNLPDSGYIFEPAVLRWARERAGMAPQHVAERLAGALAHITAPLIESWESGAARPTPTHIKKLAELYKRPTAVFLLAHPPGENPLPPDRRTLPSRQHRGLSPAALLVIRRARRVQALASELAEELGTPLSFRYPRRQLTADPSSLAARLRADLQVSTTDQLAFRRYADFFQYLRTRIEAAGMVTLRTGGAQQFPLEDARALSLTDQQPYLILINNKDTEGAKNFSLLHEFAHILLREAGICDDFTAFKTTHGRADPLEVFCNQFAASFLVPAEDLIAHRLLRGKTSIPPEQLDPLATTLATDFKVSRFVILRRLLTTNVIGADTYRSKSKEWEKEKLPKSSGGKSVPSKTALMNNGPAFSHLVLNAYRADRLSSAAVSDYLGMKSKHIPAFTKLVQAYDG